MNLKIGIKPELKKGDTVILAVSGGVDSMVMLDVIVALGLFKIVVCHMNHMLRSDSKSDADYVESIAAKYKLKFELREDDISAYAKLKGRGIEESARELRYEFLQEMRAKHKASYILTAHTSDDHVETIMLNLTRGSGLHGLEGMRRVDKKRRLLRPFLSTRKETLIEFANTYNIKYVEDSTNSSVVFSRNRIRLEVMPELRKINKKADEAIVRFGNIMSDANNFIHSQALQWVEKEGEEFTLGAFKMLHPALRREVIRIMYERIHGNLINFSYAMCEEVMILLYRAITSKRVSFGVGYEVLTQYGRASFQKNRGKIKKDEDIRAKKVLRNKSDRFSFQVFTVDQFKEGEINFKEPLTVWLDYDKLKESKLYVRYRKRGDSFCPSGMKGKTKKLQDYFTDSKVFSKLRDSVPLLVTDKDSIVWVVGMRVDEKYVLDKNSKKVLRIKYHLNK